MAGRTLIWSPETQADLKEILAFYQERNGNSEYGDRLLCDFHEKMNYVVANPYLGQKWGRRGFRYVIVNPFQLFYRVTKTEIRVSLVWDSRRNPKALRKYLRR
jgi:plasmid stabilization system protein ParE